MKKSRVGKRILAWMLVFAMLWQSAGVETLAASITASDGVETLTEEGEDKASAAEDTNVSEQPADNGAGTDNDTGITDGDTGSSDTAENIGDTGSSDTAGDIGDTENSDPGEDKQPEPEITQDVTDEVTSDLFSAKSEEEVEKPAVILNGIADGTTTQLQTWTVDELNGQNPLAAAESLIAEGKYSAYSVEIEQDLTVPAYTQTEDRSNTTLYLHGHTLTIEGHGYSFGTYTVNVEGISNDENKTFGTIKFVVKSATVDQNNTVTIGADFQSSQDTSDVYLNWQNMNIEVANDGDTSTSTGSVTVKLGEHNRVTWNEVSYNTSNGIKKKLETAMNSNLTVNDENEFVTDDVFITKWSSLTVKNKWKTTNATFDLKQSSVNAKEMEIENLTMNGDSKLFTQKSCTVNKITSNDADELLLVAEKTADVAEWPVFHINSEINDFQIRLQREVVDVAGNFEDWGTFSENDQVAILDADLIAQIKSSGKDVNDYFVADGNVEFALDEAAGSLTVVAKPEDQTKLYWIYQPGEDAESYQTGVDTLAEAKEWIAEQPENDASYVIRVNTSQVNADKTVSAGKNDLNYREQGHAVLLDLQEQVLTLTDADTVMTTSATNGQIRVSKAGSLTVYPDNSDIRWSNLTVNMNNLSEKLIVGEQNVAYSGRLVTENVEWINTGKLAVTMAANVNLTGQTLSCASLKVVGESYEVSDGKFEKQEVSIGTLKVTGNLELNGVLTVHFLENVGGTLTAVSGSTMTLTERGVINNLLVKGSGSELEESETFYLQLATPKDISFYALLINGTVSRSGKMISPVTWRNVKYTEETGEWSLKPFGWENTGSSYQIYMPKVKSALDGFFTSDLYDDSYDTYMCIVCDKVKSGTGYGVAATMSCVWVEHDNMLRRFESFEKAAASISKPLTSGGFGNDKGAYTFVMLRAEWLWNNVTLPACVTDLSIIAYEDEQKNLGKGTASLFNLGYGGKHTLKTTASTIYISPFVDIRNGILEAPSATEISMDRFSEYKLEGGYDEQWTGKGDDLTINAPNAAFYANAITWSEDKHQKTENAVFDMSEATLNVASLVSRGSTEAGTYISGAELEVQFKKLTLNSGSTSFDGKVTIPTLVQQGGSVNVESGAAVDVTTWNVTKAVAKDAISGYETIYNDGGQVKIDTLNMTAGTLYNGGASITVSTVKRLKKLVNDDQAVFHVHNYASVNGDAVWLNDESLFAVDSQYMGEGETDQPGTVVLYGLRITGTPVIQKSLSDTLTINGTPVQADEESRCTVKINEPDKTADALLKQVAVNTSMTSGFPLEMFNVTAVLRDEANPDAAREYDEFMLQQNGRQLLIAKALFVVTQKGIEEGQWIGEYANWQQVVSAINNINDAKNEYEIQVLDDTVTIDGIFTIPSKAASLEFYYESAEEHELCTLTWYGNISLPTNVTFQNFWLTPKATAKEGAAPASVALNRNIFHLENSGGVFTNVTGSANSVWQITADGAALPSETSAWVEARGSVSGITHLILSGKPDHTPTLQVTNNVTATKLTMNDAWLKTVGVRNTSKKMTSGKITVTNAITNGENNKISYPGENADSMLYVTGKVNSDEDYYDVEEEYYLSCAIIVDTTGIYNTKTANHQLLSAKNAPASWFVTENEMGEKQWTEKSGEWVIIARTAAPSVALNYGSYNEDGNEGNIYGYFGTVKEAFSQIQFLNDPTADYVIFILDDSATNVNENLGFPTKVHRLYVVNETESSIKFSFKNQIELNSNTTFVDLDLASQISGGSIKVKNYELELDSCYIPTGNKITGITGNGKGQVTVRNSVSETGKNEDETSATRNFTVNGSISGLSVLKVQSDHGTGLYVTGNVTATNLELANNAEERETALLEVDGKLTVTDVITEGDCSVQASVTLTRNTRSTDKEITRVTPNFIINGTVKGDPLKLSVVEMVKTGTTLTAQEVLFKDRLNEEAPLAGYVWGSTYKTVNDNQETVYKNIPLVLAKKTAAAKIVLNTTDSDVQKGMLYKSGGYINYMSTKDYAIELTYKTADSDGTKADQQTPCLTWADAVTEINNQAAGNSNAKNTEYTITLKTDLGSAEAEKTAPISLTFPGRNAAANVIVTSKGDAKNIYYQGNITVNTGFTLKNINLNNKVRVNGIWTNVVFGGDPKTCVKPVTLTVAGAYTLNLGDNVTFNSPLILKGNNAATLKLTAVTGKTLKTVGNRSAENTGAIDDGNLIYGSVTGFAYVDLNTDKNTNGEDANGKLYVEKYVTGKDRKGNWIYTDGAFTVVKDVTLRNAQLKAASVTVNGNVTMTDSQIEADGVFTFNKDLTYTGSKNALTTIRKSAADLTPYLTIKGNAASTDESTITVKVLNSDGTIPMLAVMGDTFTAAQKTTCRRLLVAPKADISLFVPDSANLKEENTNPYDIDEKTGYIFFRDKSGYVNIYYADEVQAAVYVEDAASADEELLGYYVTWADAVAAVNAYKSSDLAEKNISIVLCNNLGSALQPISLTMPSTKATVEITACDGNSDLIYYNNNISLRSNTVFRGIMLAPTAVKTVKGVKKAYGISRDIAVGSYSFTMDTVVVSGVDASIGSITGAGSKTAEYEFDGDKNTRYDLTGKLAITNGTVYIRKNVAVQAAGALSVQTLVLHAGAELDGKAAMKIGDIVYTDQLTNPPMIGTWRTVEKKGLDNSQFTLTGGVYAGFDENGKPAGAGEGKIILAVHENNSTEENPHLIDASGYELIYNRAGDSNVKLTVPATKKLADIPKEYLSHFEVEYGDAEDPTQTYHLVKYAGGVYLGTDSLDPYEVELENAYGESTTCLDLNQVATEIANLAAPTEEYTVVVPTELTDTCITDATAASSLVLPAANKAEKVVYTNEKQNSEVRFLAAGGVKPAGIVTFENFVFDPVVINNRTNAMNPANPALTMSASTMTVDGKKTSVSGVTLENCSFKNAQTLFASVTGVRNVSALTMDGCKIGVLGTMQYVNDLDLFNGTDLTTLGTVNVNAVTMEDTDAKASTWNAWGATTISTSLTSWMQNKGSYIGTRRVDAKTGKSAFAVNGSASAGEGQRIWIKVMKDTTTQADVLNAYKTGTLTSAKLYRGGSSADLTDPTETYKDISLLAAPKADAGIFRAHNYQTASADVLANLISYKDLNYNVKNGDKREMAVEITRESDEKSDATTYAKTFSQAVTMINRAGTGVKAADYDAYTITILTANAEQENGQLLVKTAQTSKQAPAYGALTLPTYAKAVTIKSDSTSTVPALKFTGAVTPRCDTTFDGVKLVAGTVSGGKWQTAKEQAPTISMSNTRWTLTLPKETDTYTSITAPQGQIVIPAGADVTVNGAVSAKTLSLAGELHVKGNLTATTLTAASNDAAVTGEKVMTFTDLTKQADDAALKLTTYRTARPANKISRTQLTINGEITVPTSIQMMVYDQKKINGKLEDTHVFGMNDMKDYELGVNGKPTENVKLAVIPKASLADVTLLVEDSDTSYAKNLPLWKYEKGMYLAESKYAVNNGGLPIIVTAQEDGTSVYEASFMNWAQAVKEIDVIAKKARTYTITLTENAGDNGTIGTLTMPAQAAKLTVKSNDDHGRYVFFTGTAITLRCPTEFDRIGLIGVLRKASGKTVWYENRAYTLNAGNYDLIMKNMLESGNFEYKANQGNTYAYLSAIPSRISGGAKSTLTWEMTTNWSNGDDFYYVDNMQTQPAEQITGFGTVDLKLSDKFDHKVGSTVVPVKSKEAILSVPKGISGISSLKLNKGVTLNVTAGNVAVKDAQINGCVKTRNYTSTGTTTMHLGVIDAGMWVKNTVTGAVRMNQVKLETMDNQIIGRKNRSNVSQIVITGAVTKTENFDKTATSEDVAVHAPIIICLTEYARNSKAQLVNGMVLLQAPKVTQEQANEIFAPKYSRYDDESGAHISGMGTVPDGAKVMILKPVRTNNLTWNMTL